MKRIDANARTIRELLDGARFSIDSYQREYAWKERQIQDLIRRPSRRVQVAAESAGGGEKNSL